MAEEVPKWSAQKIFILLIVVAFFVSSFGLTGLVVWQEVTAKDSTKTTATNDKTQNKEGKLEGTQLQGFEPVASVTELKTIDTKAGDGAEATAASKVTVHYTGAVASTGQIFQSSLDTGQPVTFSLDGVIVGWKEGIPGMKVGGTRRLIIPAEKAYGANPPQGSNIPANAPLVFDVQLISVE